MGNLNKIPKTGTFGAAIDAINANFELVTEAIAHWYSAYQVWRQQGHEGTEEDFLRSLTAYGIAVEHGYVGTEEQWLASLKGNDGVVLDGVNTFNTAADVDGKTDEQKSLYVPTARMVDEMEAKTTQVETEINNRTLVKDTRILLVDSTSYSSAKLQNGTLESMSSANYKWNAIALPENISAGDTLVFRINNKYTGTGIHSHQVAFFHKEVVGGELQDVEVGDAYIEGSYIAKSVKATDTEPFDLYVKVPEGATHVCCSNYYTSSYPSNSSIYTVLTVDDRIKDNKEKIEQIGTSTDTSVTADLTFSDDNDYEIVRFENGHIKTKNFDSEEAAENIEKSVKTDDSLTSDFTISDENGNEIVRFRGGHIITKKFDSSVGATNYKDYQQETKYTYSVDGTMPYEPYVEGTDMFTTMTNKSVVTSQSKFYTDRAALYLPTTYSSTGTPTRLVIFGRQGGGVFTSSNNFAWQDINNTEDGNYLRIVPYLLSLGYAVLAVDGSPDTWIQEMLYPATIKSGDNPMEGYVNGNYIAVRSVKKAYDLVIKDYNIAKDGVFGYGYSQGGWMIMNVAELSGIPFLGVVMKSPVAALSTYFDGIGGYVVSPGGIEYPRWRYFMIRQYYGINPALDEMPLEDFMAIPNEPMRWGGYDHFSRYSNDVPTKEDIAKINSEEMFDDQERYVDLPLSTQLTKFSMTRNCKFPIKIWIAINDSVVGYKRQCVFIKALQNAGCFGDIRLYSNGDHYLGPTYWNVMGTFDYNGRTYNLYPPTYEMAAFFSKFGGIKPTYDDEN